MTKVEKIDQEIEQLKDELTHVEGTKTEIYARIVGYYRSVKNWNKGKKEEYKFRKEFCTEASTPTRKGAPAKPVAEKEQPAKAVAPAATATDEAAPVKEGYLYFYRTTCPNCPPVKNYLKELNETTVEVNVDTEEGLKLAARYDVMATPTALYFDEQGTERFRGSSVVNLKKAVATAC